MKTLITITLTLFFIATLSIQSLTAQSSERFDRDIRIAEGIIEGLFEADGSSGPFGRRLVRNVTGSYVPGYGIHFRINAALTPAAVRLVLENQTEIHIDGDSDPEELRELGREYVEERFMEYFINYAPLFDELPDGEVIRLSMGTRNSPVNAFSIQFGSPESQRIVARITAWATTEDIRALDSGSISEQEFENRVEIRDLSELDTTRDQTVFASILQTALDDVSDSIRVSREPFVENLPGVGLSYYVNASLRGGSLFDFGDVSIEAFSIEMDSLRLDISDALGNIDFDEITRMADRIDSMYAPHADSLEKSMRQYTGTVESSRDPLSDEEVRDLIDRFNEALKETVMTYGSTLRSMDDDDMLIISINWRGRHSALPERTELRIRKSDILNDREPDIEQIN